MDNTAAGIEKIAERILDEGRTRLLMRLRFLHSALFCLQPMPSSEIAAAATEGTLLMYDPYSLIRGFREDTFYPRRMWMHCMLHCLFRHMFVNKKVIRSYWDIACDIAVESIIYDIFPEERRRGRSDEWLKQLSDEVYPLTAEKVYRFLIDSSPSETVLKSLEQAFALDDHSVWYLSETGRDIHGGERGTEGEGSGGETHLEHDKLSTDKKGSEANAGETPEKLEGPGGNDGRKMDGRDEGEPADQSSKERIGSAESIWKDISDRVRTELETFSRMASDQDGALMQALELPDPEEYDYERFLRRFMTRCEVVETSKEEFDYIYYTYGIQLYGDMPLIEPLEYREDKRVRDIVIVIDTSGSVRGDKVIGFLRKTANIMGQEKAFERRFRLHILQCDKSVREDALITGMDEFDEYIDNMVLSGFGGTDFRPAFEYVEQLRRDGAFQSLRGLIYFTDGEGRYPESVTDYLTAFAFIDSRDLHKAEVPLWAMKILIDTDRFGTDRGIII